MARPLDDLMPLRDLVLRALSLPPHVAAGRAIRLLLRVMAENRNASQQLGTCSYVTEKQNGTVPTIAVPSDDLAPWAEALLAEAANIQAHRFDLLGSGPVDWSRDGSAPPRINPGNRAVSSALYARLPRDYRPFDWHRDVASGHAWPSDQYCTSIRPVFGNGADIKRPWEIARLQHLPRLALCAALDRPDEAGKALDEIRNQLLDFSAGNPPSFGVAWACTMDVAIRAANVWLTVSLVNPRDADAAEIRDHAHAMLREHGRHVSSHLEWAPDIRGNHYLCDLAGLAFCGMAFDDAESDVWLAFALAEFTHEARLQMLADGCNFEASTSYHRLVSETIAWTFAALNILSPDRLHRLDSVAPERMPRPLQARMPAATCLDQLRGIIAAAARLTAAIQPAGGVIPQIGDNDDGRFIALDPARDLLDHRGLLALIGRLTGWDDAMAAAGPDHLDAMVAVRLMAATPERWSRSLAGSFEAFTDFGLFVWRRGPAHLTFRCGPVGQRGNGGHAHNDQLSITLAVNGVDVLIDTGTGHYTGWPDWRNHFRATAAHNTLIIEGREQNDWESGSMGLFRLQDQARTQVISVNADGADALHHGYGEPHRRHLRFTDHGLDVSDSCMAPGRKKLHFHLGADIACQILGNRARLSGPGVTVRLEAEGGSWRTEPAHRSDGYGRVTGNTCLVFDLAGDTVAWRLNWR